jgi:hypothetical protein
MRPTTGMSVENATRLASVVNTSCSTSTCIITLDNELMRSGAAMVQGSTGASVTTQVRCTRYAPPLMAPSLPPLPAVHRQLALANYAPPHHPPPPLTHTPPRPTHPR